MQKRYLFAAASAALIAACVFAKPARSQNAPGVPVSVVVTLEPKRGATPEAPNASEVKVREDRDQRPTIGFEPLPADAPSQLLLMFDDSARSSFDTEIPVLKNFVTSLPPNMQVAIGYMRNGMTEIVSNFTNDHAAAANSIRLVNGPGGADVSPYDSLTDAVKKWPQTGAKRREVIMISSGIEGLGGGFAPENPYVNAGIESALKAGIIVYTIYTPSVGHFGHSFYRMNWGQNFLAQLSDETGGEVYWEGFGSPVSFEPFLKEWLERQQHQYILTFTARPEKKAGFQSIHVTAAEKDVSIAAPDKVFVPASL